MLTEEDEKLINDIMEGESMNDGREYRYQVDWQFAGLMYHVRCDDWEEFKTAKQNMETLLPKTAAFPDDTGNIATPPSAVAAPVPVCGVHGLPMKQRTGQYGMFWACGQKNADGTWCKVKPKI